MSGKRKKPSRDKRSAPKGEQVLGIHAVSALIQANPGLVTGVWIDARVENNQRVDEVRAMAKAAGIMVSDIDHDELESASGGVRHQGVMALCKSLPSLDENDLKALLETLDRPAFLLVLDGVQDPHNLGACIRSADAAGVDAVIAPKDRAVGLTAVVRKVASGGAETVPYIQVTNLARTLKSLKDQEIWVIGADEGGASSCHDTDLGGAVAIVMGAEGKGLRRLTRENCDLIMSIPMAGAVSSLNVSVATGVCLFEIVRQRAIAAKKLG